MGTTVQQKYRITRLLGVGGMAAVYAAVHRNGHSVAIKFLLDCHSYDSVAYRLFRREAYVANRVGHPGAVPVLDDDVDEDGCTFLIMPLLQGQTLRARWERAGKRLPMVESIVGMLDVLDVLASAHAKGIVHRDIKPDNLFVTAKGEVWVLDFGIARQNDASVATMTGRVMGTPAFMPPEQALGDREAVGPSSDCWAVGATLFALLSGQLVHATNGPGVQLAAAATRRARRLADAMPDVPAPVARVVDKALAFEPANRWASAQEMRDALVNALEEVTGESAARIIPRIRADVAVQLSPDAADQEETQSPDRDVPDGATLQPLRLGTAPPSRQLGWLVALAALASLAMSILLARTHPAPTERRPSVSVEQPQVESDFGPPGAAVHVKTGLQNWRDASKLGARKSFAINSAHVTAPCSMHLRRY
ncbi:serine/threonine protein kinase [Pendulispora rubella]|uniref:Serine/threonine protein kinase n=1 Tax=Pendulispora rubella TaxID=2741070 RepID=A0ABZ2L7E4_9BACT